MTQQHSKRACRSRPQAFMCSESGAEMPPAANCLPGTDYLGCCHQLLFGCDDVFRAYFSWVGLSAHLLQHEHGFCAVLTSKLGCLFS